MGIFASSLLIEVGSEVRSLLGSKLQPWIRVTKILHLIVVLFKPAVVFYIELPKKFVEFSVISGKPE